MAFETFFFKGRSGWSLDETKFYSQLMGKFDHVAHILTTRTDFICSNCRERRTIRGSRIGINFTVQSHRFYGEHCYCTSRDLESRLKNSAMIVYEQKQLLQGREARRHLSAQRIPPYIAIEYKKLLCEECKIEEIILGMNRNERDIHLWDFIQLHRFCKREKRAERCEVF